MNRTAAWNLGVFALSLAASMGSAFSHRAGAAATMEPAEAPAHVREPLRDHQGVLAPERHYTRIASVSTIADAALRELCDPARVIAWTHYSATHEQRYHFAGKPTVASLADVESILALKPDLVLVSAHTDARPVERLRDAGLVVFELGEMRGLTTLIPNLREVARLVGAEADGERMVRRITAGMATVAIDVPQASRKRGLYLSVYGGRFFGAGERTSYYDVLTAAGILPAVPGLRDWPTLSTEDVLAADPDVIVTHGRQSETICAHPGFEALRACTTHGVVEADDERLGDPGPAMLDVAQDVRALVYGPPSPSASPPAARALGATPPKGPPP